MQLIITAGPEAVEAIILRDHQATINSELRHQIRRYYNHRSHIVQKMKAAGFTGGSDETRTTRANMLYFQCEAIETRIMAGAFRKLLLTENPSSLIWLHDGMYINQAVHPDQARKAIRESANEIGIHEIQVKITNCTDAYKAMLQPDSDPASKPLVDEVNAVLDNNAQKQSAAGGKPVDLSKPLGKIKGALYKKGQRKQGDP